MWPPLTRGRATMPGSRDARPSTSPRRASPRQGLRRSACGCRSSWSAAAASRRRPCRPGSGTPKTPMRGWRRRAAPATPVRQGRRGGRRVASTLTRQPSARIGATAPPGIAARWKTQSGACCSACASTSLWAMLPMTATWRGSACSSSLVSSEMTCVIALPPNTGMDNSRLTSSPPTNPPAPVTRTFTRASYRPAKRSARN